MESGGSLEKGLAWLGLAQLRLASVAVRVWGEGREGLQDLPKLQNNQTP